MIEDCDVGIVGGVVTAVVACVEEVGTGEACLEGLGAIGYKEVAEVIG